MVGENRRGGRFVRKRVWAKIAEYVLLQIFPCDREISNTFPAQHRHQQLLYTRRISHSAVLRLRDNGEQIEKLVRSESP